MNYKKEVITMFEIITQDRFRTLMGQYINKSADAALYGIDVVYPLLEKLRFEEAQPLMSGYGGLINTLDILSTNIDIMMKDKLTDETSDIVYYLNEAGLPAKTTTDEFNRLIKGMQTEFDEEYPTGYLQKPPDEDEKMFV
jgi:hypothetical protein